MKKQSSLYITLAMMTLLLSSCGIYSRYASTSQAPANLYGTDMAVKNAQQEASVAALSWREFFTDPLLQQLIDSALVRNTDMKSAHITVEQAQLMLRTAKLAYLPSLGINATGNLSGFNGAAKPKTYQIGLNLDWQLDLFGSLTNNKRQAAAMLEQSRRLEDAARADIVSTVAQLYNQLQIYDRQLEILLHTEKLWAASLDVQRALMENGRAYSTAVNQMEASYLNVKTQIVDIRREINSVELAMCRLLVIVPGHIARSQWNAYKLPARLGTGVPAELLAMRSDVQVAERAMEAAFYDVNAARSAFYPNINIGGLLGWTNNGGDVIVNPGKLLLNAVGSLAQPVFARGKLLANLKASKLTQQDIVNRYVQTVIDAGNEVNQTMTDCQTAAEKDILLKRQVAVLQDAYDGTHELMNNGKANYLEVLTAQEALLQAQLAEAMNIYDGNVAKIALYVALGGATK